ncbi:DUF805 domain-containing protein, partial [Enterobacter hormaechei]
KYFYTVTQSSTSGFAALIIIGIYSLATIIPNIAVTVRRFHDQERFGWMVLLSFIPLLAD